VNARTEVRVRRATEGRAHSVTAPEPTEQAFILAEIALSAAAQALDTAQAAERAASEAAALAQVAHDAAQSAYDFAEVGRGG
jgi:hypothetical protein